MADSLRRLVDIGSFSILQEKLERWNRDYYRNTSDENVARACEIVELNARVQGQLFKLLSICASEGGLYGAGAAVIRSRLLPLLGHGFFTSGLSSDASLSVIADAASKEREIEEVKNSYEQSLGDLEDELKKSKDEAENFKAELEDTKQELERQSRASASDKMFNESEIRDLKFKLSQAESENDRLRARARLADDYDRQVRNLREEIALLQGRYPLPLPLLPPPPPPPASRSRTPLPAPPPAAKEESGDDAALEESINQHTSYRRPLTPVSPLSASDPVQRSKQQALVARFSDAFSVARLDAMDALRRYYDDQENNQRIVYNAVLEAFNAAKVAFRAFKSRVRSQLLISHRGPETLEEAVQDYINYNCDLCDLNAIVQEVLRSLNRNYRLYLPPGIGFDVILPFIREISRLALEMSALARPLDVAIGYDGEFFDDYRYRRSYDSEYTAPLVGHHVWPALLQDGGVVTKGEACTRRGSAYQTPRSRSLTRPASRAQSPSRGLSPARTATNRSRTPRPRGKAAGASGAAAAANGGAAGDLAASTARTASTSLSQYFD